MVLDPVGIRCPTPWARRPISLALAVFHAAPSLPLRRAGSSSILPVEGSTAAPAKREASAVGAVWILAADADPNMDSICAA